MARFSFWHIRRNQICKSTRAITISKLYSEFNLIVVSSYLFIMYLMTLSVAQTIQHRMIEWLVNNELKTIRKQSWYNLIIIINYLQGLRETMKNLSHDSHCPSQDLNQAPAEYKSSLLPHEPTRLVFIVVSTEMKQLTQLPKKHNSNKNPCYSIT
jgi:hypothetical protein